MRTVITVAVVSILLLPSALSQHSSELTAYEDEDAYKIYSVLLPHEEAVDFAKGTLVIRQETEPASASSSQCLTPDAASQFKDAIADFSRINRKRRLLQRRFEIEKPHEIVPSDTIELTFKESGWNGFFARYPDSGGYIIMSAVGFKKDRTLAAVYTGSSCSGLCGRWSLHLLRKVDGEWKTVPGVTCVKVS